MAKATKRKSPRPRSTIEAVLKGPTFHAHHVLGRVLKSARAVKDLENAAKSDSFESGFDSEATPLASLPDKQKITAAEVLKQAHRCIRLFNTGDFLAAVDAAVAVGLAQGGLFEMSTRLTDSTAGAAKGNDSRSKSVREFMVEASRYYNSRSASDKATLTVKNIWGKVCAARRHKSRRCWCCKRSTFFKHWPDYIKNSPPR